MSFEKVKSLVWADYFLYALTDPRELYRLVKTGSAGNILVSLSVPAFVTLADILALLILANGTGFFYYCVSYGWILVFFYTILKIAVYSSLIDAASQFMGYKGSIREMITVVSFSLFPKVFILPAVYFFSIINFAPGFFYVFISFLLFLWHVMVLIQGISEMHSVAFSKALAIYVLPGIFTVLALFFMLVVIVFAGVGIVFG